MKKKNLTSLTTVLAALLLIIGFTSCKTTSISPATRLADGKLDAVLWTQTSPEYAVSTTQTYRAAAVNLNKALADKNWTAAVEQTGAYADLPPCVIFDLDETLLDNSPFQAYLVEEGIDFNPDLWTEWVFQKKAKALPGAQDLINLLKKKGVTIFYVTNRSVQEEDSTLANVQQVLDPDATKENLMVKGEYEGGSNKSPRRTLIAKSHRILLLFGDDFNDFYWLGTGTTVEDRMKEAQKYQQNWGVKWMLLSNPQYGTWERAMYQYNSEMPDAEKFEKKVKYLKPMKR